jgi:hypothetical protein
MSRHGRRLGKSRRDWRLNCVRADETLESPFV